MADEILFAVDDGVATITMNRPDRRNALSTALIDALRDRFTELETRADVRVVVVRGAGPAFCAGMDLDELRERQMLQADPERDVTAIFQQIERSRHPTIAMVHGDAFAGGCELALHCDLRVAAEPARFAMPLARIGLILPFVLAQKLVEVIGPAMTREILFTGRPIDGRRAYEIGMVHRVVAAAEIEAETYAMARTIAENAPQSLAGMKAVIQRALSLREQIRHADLDEVQRRARKSPEARERLRRMREKRRS